MARYASYNTEVPAYWFTPDCAKFWNWFANTRTSHFAMRITLFSPLLCWQSLMDPDIRLWQIQFQALFYWWRLKRCEMKCCKTLLTYHTNQLLSNHQNCKTFKSSCTSLQHFGDELYVVESEDKPATFYNSGRTKRFGERSVPVKRESWNLGIRTAGVEPSARRNKDFPFPRSSQFTCCILSHVHSWPVSSR